MATVPVTLPIPGLSGDAGVYVSGEDWLRVRSLGEAGGRALLVSGRYLLVGDGRVHPFASRHVPVAGATPTTTEIPLGECWLQSVTVNAEDGLPIGTSIFVRVDLVRGRGTAGVILATLLQGELSALGGLGWPSVPGAGTGGAAAEIRMITIAGPAAGAEFVQVVPVRVRWRIRSLFFILTTGAAVANREAGLQWDDGALVYGQTYSGVTQLASLSREYTAAPAGIRGAASVAPAIAIALPDLTLPAGHRLRSVTNALNPADQYAPIRMQVEEFAEP